MKEQLVRLAIMGAMTAHFIHAMLKSEPTTTSWIFNTGLSLLGCLMCISELSFAWKRFFYLPPGSIGYIPAIGEMIEFLLSPPKFFLSRLKKFGSPFLMHILLNPTVNLTTSEELTFLWNAERKGQAKVGWPAHFIKILGSGSILMTNGAAHRSLRRLLEPAFSPSSVRGYVNIMDETIQEFLNDLHDQQHQGGEGKDISLSSTTFKYFALKIFFSTVFGKDIPDSTIRQLDVELKNILDGAQSIIPFDIPGTRFHTAMQSRYKSLATIETLISNFKDKYNENSPEATQTLMGRLCYGPSSRDGEPLSNQAMSENLLTILIAGHDTTYASIGSLMYYLSSHPEIVRALEQEVQEFLAKRQGSDKKSDKTSSGLDYTALKDELPILNAFTAEVWRIVPPITFVFRKLNQTISHKKYTFHKGITMCYNIFLCCQDEERYPDPQEFRIERFLPPNHPFVVEKRRTSGKEAEGNDYYKGLEFIQKRQCYPVFGGGSHSCLGSHFAHLELRIFLLRLVERYSLEVKKAVLVPLTIQTWQCEFTLQKKNVPVH